MKFRQFYISIKVQVGTDKSGTIPTIAGWDLKSDQKGVPTEQEYDALKVGAHQQINDIKPCNPTQSKQEIKPTA